MSEVPGAGVSGADIFIATRGGHNNNISWGHHLRVGTHVWVASALMAGGHISGRNFSVFIEEQCLIRRVFCFHLSGRSFGCDLWRANVGGETRLVRRGHKSRNENLLMCIILQIMWKLHRKIIINTTLWTRCIRSQAQKLKTAWIAFALIKQRRINMNSWGHKSWLELDFVIPLKLFNFPWPPHNLDLHRGLMSAVYRGRPRHFPLRTLLSRS